MRYKPKETHQPKVHTTSATSASVSHFFPLTFSDCLYITYVCMLLQSFLITSILFIPSLPYSSYNNDIFFVLFFVSFFFSIHSVWTTSCHRWIFFLSFRLFFPFTPVSTFIALQCAKCERASEMVRYGELWIFTLHKYKHLLGAVCYMYVLLS